MINFNDASRQRDSSFNFGQNVAAPNTAPSIIKPSYLEVIPANIPAGLQAFPQWVNWRAVWVPGHNVKPGRWTKPPYQPSGHPASVTNPAHWSDFSEVVSAYFDLESDFDGIGFVLTAADPFTAFDLDGCVADNVIVEPVREIIRQMASYTEFSPSGTGIRIFVKGQMQQGGKRAGKVEVYCDGRYVTLTGNRLEVAK